MTIDNILQGNPKGRKATVMTRESYSLKYEIRIEGMDFGRTFKDVNALAQHIRDNPRGLHFEYESDITEQLKPVLERITTQRTHYQLAS